MASRAKKASAPKRAKKPKAAAAPKAAASKPAESTLLLPPTKTVQDLAKSKRNTKKRLQGISGEHGTEVQKAVENKHLDRKAFSIACQLDALPDERLHITYYHLLRYMEDLGVVKRATAQEELFGEGSVVAGEDQGEDEGEDDDNEFGGEADNVTPIGSAARRVAEAAGGV